LVVCFYNEFNASTPYICKEDNNKNLFLFFMDIKKKIEEIKEMNHIKHSEVHGYQCEMCKVCDEIINGLEKKKIVNCCGRYWSKK
jgi:hypothetical protein